MLSPPYTLLRHYHADCPWPPLKPALAVSVAFLQPTRPVTTETEFGSLGDSLRNPVLAPDLLHYLSVH